MKKIGVLGAGSWGLTLAWLWAKPIGNEDPAPDIWLWDRKPEKIEALRQNRHVEFPLRLDLPENIALVTDFTPELADTDIIVLVVTAEGTPSDSMVCP